MNQTIKSNMVNPENMYNASNFGQYMYARKTGADFTREMARSIKVMLENWQGSDLSE
ncbi:MAG: hypothetical protein ACLFPF_09375 [Halanaerobiales bacterium]